VSSGKPAQAQVKIPVPAAPPASAPAQSAKPSQPAQPTQPAAAAQSAPASQPADIKLVQAGDQVQAPAAEPPKPALPTWEIKTGALLQEQIHEWAAKAGWKDRWETDLNFRITDPIDPIHGSFEDAAARLIEIYRSNLSRVNAKRNFGKPRIYSNNVIIFSEM
jgi:hypothetical protein